MDVAVVKPALRLHHAVFGVDADGDLVAKGIDGVDDELRILDRRRAEDHAVDAAAEIIRHRLHAADAAADLHQQSRGLGYVGDQIGVDELGVLGAVQIDHVHPLGAGVLKALGGFVG